MEKGAGKHSALSRRFSAGGVVYKQSKGKSGDLKILWLVAKSRPSDLYPNEVWRLPKGWIDDLNDGQVPGPLASGERKAKEEEIQEAALREVVEEGGVKAKIISKLGTEKYFLTVSGQRILKFTTFYLMEWAKDLKEGPDFETEKVEWLPYKKARKRLSYSGEKKILDKAKQVLDQGIQESLV